MSVPAASNTLYLPHHALVYRPSEWGFFCSANYKYVEAHTPHIILHMLHHIIKSSSSLNWETTPPLHISEPRCWPFRTLFIWLHSHSLRCEMGCWGTCGKTSFLCNVHDLEYHCASIPFKYTFKASFKNQINPIHMHIPLTITICNVDCIIVKVL
jgi:hypothetical protein